MNGGRLRSRSRFRSFRASVAVICAVGVAAGLGCPREATLDECIGQMLMVGFRGYRVDAGDAVADQLKRLRLGGVILFDYDVPSKNPERNIASPDQVRDLTSDLRRYAAPGLLIAVDQEGGRIQRLKPRFGFPDTASQQELGRLDSEKATKSQAKKIADTLREVGINVNFAPVLDLNVYPNNPVIAKYERSFSADPEIVSRNAAWMIEEFHKAGILCAVKHFPGHGSSRGDSHIGLPDVTEYWSELELAPYREVFAKVRVDMVMTAHLYNRHWDESYPATLSHAVTGDLLRGELGFRGVAVSDDLDMGAIVNRFDLRETIELALKAGIDMLVFSNNVGRYDERIGEKAAGTIRELVAQGKVSEARIRDSCRRIQEMKARLK